MSIENTASDYSADTADESTAIDGGGTFGSAVPFEAVGFWLAVMLPVPTVLLLASGVSSIYELAAVGGLLAANLLAFYLGHEYSTDKR